MSLLESLKSFLIAKRYEKRNRKAYDAACYEWKLKGCDISKYIPFKLWQDANASLAEERRRKETDGQSKC